MIPVDGLLVGLLLAVPIVGVLSLVLPMLADRPLRERYVLQVARATTSLHLLVAVALVVRFALEGAATVDLGQWYGDAEYSLELLFRIDGVSAAAVVVSATLCLVILRYGENYLHREPGHLRYFGINLLALSCFDVIALAGSLDLLFVGWELLGLCSFTLIAFFHAREATVARGLQAAISYRVGDLGLLFALILLHGADRSVGLAGMGEDAGPLAAVCGVLLLMTAASKSGLGPFSGWLGRSMEGPTSSTALFYAGLSVAAGPYLLLRAWPVFSSSVVARGCLVVFGLIAARNDSAQARTRPDVKGAVVLAGAGQVGLIVAEVGLGLHTLAGLHMLANLGLRVWQVLRAGNALQLAHRRESLRGRALPTPHPLPVVRWLWSSEGWFEPVVQRGVRIVLQLSSWLDGVSRGLEKRASGPQDEGQE